MIRSLFIFIICLLFFQTVNAQTSDTTVYYMKNNGEKLSDRHNADYIIVVLAPDTASDPNLFVINEFYPSGKIKLRTKAVDSTLPIHFQGTYLSYYENGHKQFFQTVNDGKVVGEATGYYPNGNLHMTYTVKGEKSFLTECRDSTGNVLCKDGNGQWLVFDATFKYREQGPVVNGFPDGEWNGVQSDSIKYTINFKKGEIKSGIGYDKAGNLYPFKKAYVEPKYNGLETYGQFLSRNYKCPDFVKQHKLYQYVKVGFTIEKDGNIDNIHIIQGQTPSLNEEALREVGLTPQWTPARSFGVPVSCDWNVSIYFHPL